MICTVEQTVDVSVSQVVEEIIELKRLVPQERVVQRQVEQIVNVLVLRMMEEFAEVVKIFL